MLKHFLHILPIFKHFIISRQKAAWGLLKLKFFRRKFLADTSAIRGGGRYSTPLPLKEVKKNFQTKCKKYSACPA